MLSVPDMPGQLMERSMSPTAATFGIVPLTLARWNSALSWTDLEYSAGRDPEIAGRRCKENFPTDEETRLAKVPETNWLPSSKSLHAGSPSIDDANFVESLKTHELKLAGRVPETLESTISMTGDTPPKGRVPLTWVSLR